jgi:hypothetical protein
MGNKMIKLPKTEQYELSLIKGLLTVTTKHGISFQVSEDLIEDDQDEIIPNLAMIALALSNLENATNTSWVIDFIDEFSASLKVEVTKKSYGAK